MKFIDKIKDHKLYKNIKITLSPYDRKKTKDNVLYSIQTDSFDNLVTEFNNPLIKKRYFKVYATDKLTVVKLKQGGMRRFKVDPTVVTKEAKSKLGVKSTFYKSLSGESKNVIIDDTIRISTYLNAKSSTPLVIYDYYLSYLKSFFHREGLDNYKRRYIHVPFTLSEDTIEEVGGDFGSLLINEKKCANSRDLSIYWFRLLTADSAKLAQAISGIDDDSYFDYLNMNMDSIPRYDLIISSKEGLIIKYNLTEYIREWVANGDDKKPLVPFDRIKLFYKIMYSVSIGDLDSLSEEEKKELIDGDSIPDDTGTDNTPIRKTVEALHKHMPATVDDDDLEEIEDVVETLLDNGADNDLTNNEELAGVIDDTISGLSPAQQRIYKINKTKYKELRISTGETINDVLKRSKAQSIEPLNIDVGHKNKGVNNCTAVQFRKSYFAKQFEPDVVNTLLTLSNPNVELPLHLTDYKLVDTSDMHNDMQTLTFTMKDKSGKSHTNKVHFPIFKDGIIMKTNGGLKFMSQQLTLQPIVKIGPNSVRVSTWHNKAEIYRKGTKLSGKTEVLKKFIKKHVPDINDIVFNLGNCTIKNSAYLTTLEYDEFAGDYHLCTIGNEEKFIKIYFDQETIRERITEEGIKYNDKDGKLLPVAITNDNTVISLNTITNKTSVKIDGSNKSFSDLLRWGIDEYSSTDTESLFSKITIPNGLVYAECLLISKRSPVGIMLAYMYGLDEVLNKMGVKYKIVDRIEGKRIPKLSSSEKLNLGQIVFADKIMYYDLYPFRHSLVLNGLRKMDTELYTLDEMNGIDRLPYIDYFESVWGNIQITKGYNGVKEYMIDPRSADIIVRRYGIKPHNLDVFLYATGLLEDKSYIRETSAEANRIRHGEILVTMFYKEMVKEYLMFKHRSGNTKGKFSIDPDCILKRLGKSPIVASYDVLNPIREFENAGSITYKGEGGLNTDRAYTQEKRSYDETMMGILAISTPDSGAVGITKHGTVNARILNTYGELAPADKKDMKNIDFTSMGNAAELLVPYAINKDNAKRVAFVTKESKHLTPTNTTNRMLFGNGMERTMAHVASSMFINKAKDDGQVIKVDDVNNLVIVKYKDGTSEGFSTQSDAAKNGGGGFYINNKKESVYAEGRKFKKGDILIKNPTYFKNDKGQQNIEYAIGALAEVAVMIVPGTFEDSSVVSESLGNKLSADVIMKKPVVFSDQSIINSIKEVGDEIRTDEVLMSFEDAYDDDDANQLLSFLGDHASDVVNHKPKAKHAGKVSAIKIFYTSPIEDMSESCQKLINRYRARINKRIKVLRENGIPNPEKVIGESVEQVTPYKGKIDGEMIEPGQILVEFYTQYTDYVNGGDKILFYASIKSVVQRKLPNSIAPFVIRNGKKVIVEAIVSPISIKHRQVTSIHHAIGLNKGLIQLKHNVIEMYHGRD